MFRLAILLALLPTAALASIDYPPVTVDLSNYATFGAVSTAITAAAPAPCTTPDADTLNGSAGTGSCTASPTSTRPTSVQAANTTVDASCNWAITFARSFVSTTPIVKATIYLPGATQPMPCITTARSATASSGKCFPGQATLLNLSIITTGLTLSPFASTCPAGTAVMIVAREPTQ